jgi:hypothetical protein
MDIVSLTGLLKIELPTADVLLCDGGWFPWAGDVYQSRDPVFGVIGSVEGLEEGVGDELPALELEFVPADDAAVSDLSQPGFQQSRVRLWVGEYDPETGAIVGTPELEFDGMLDQTTLRVGRSERTLASTIVPTAERLFQRNIGNSLSPGFHKTLFAGELGHDNATGLKVAVAWGVASPARATGNSGGGGGGGFGSGTLDGIINAAQR